MRAALTLLVLVASACGGDFTDSDIDALKKGQAPAAPTYALRTSDARSATPVWKTAFTVASTYQVFFATEVSGVLPGHHVQSVFVFAPGGAAYARYDVAFATDVAATAGEQQAERTANGYRVWVSMPVNGTMISEFNMVGAWTANTYVDSASAPTAAASFSLK